MTGKGHWPVDAGARAELLQEVELPDQDHATCEIDMHVAVNGHSALSWWKAPLVVSTTPVWLRGSKVTETLSDRRTLRAQDLGFEYGAPTEDDAEEDS